MTATAEAGPLPAYASLTWDQGMGRACVWCNLPIEDGGREVGTVRETLGAHKLKALVFAGPCCPPVVTS